MSLFPYRCLSEPTQEATPIGLRPKCIVDALRVKEIIAAMERYAADGKKIDMEWIEELTDLNEGIE